jgi:hypothetical protein
MFGETVELCPASISINACVARQEGSSTFGRRDSLNSKARAEVSVLLPQADD